MLDWQSMILLLTDLALICFVEAAQHKDPCAMGNLRAVPAWEQLDGWLS